MAQETRLNIAIDSRKAKQGGRETEKALQRMKRQADRTHRAGVRGAQQHNAALLALARRAKFVAAAVAALFAVTTIKKTKDFGFAIAELSAITGAVGNDLDFLRQKSLEFGETTTLTASQAAEAFKLIASAKPDLLENVKALSLVTKEAIALAEATGQDLPTAADTLGASLNQFGVAATESSRFINVLAAGSKRGAALVGDVAESLKFAGVVAANANISFEETNALIQSLSLVAIKGSEAGTQLRGVLLALQSQSDDKLNPAIVGIDAALENLAKKELSAADMARLFGRRNLVAAATIIKNREQVKKLTDQLTDTTVAYEQQSIKINNLDGDVKTLKSAYEGLQLEIGSQLNSALRLSARSATDFIRNLTKGTRTTKIFSGAMDLLHRISQDLKITWDQLVEAIKSSGPDWELMGDQAVRSIDLIINAIKFLWKQFVVLGPANLRLGFTIMIAAIDQFVITFKEVMRVGMFVVLKGFISWAGKISDIFTGLKIKVGSIMDDAIEGIATKLLEVGQKLEGVKFLGGFGEDITEAGQALQDLAKFEAKAQEQLEKEQEIREAKLAVLTELINETVELANTQRAASDSAIFDALAERDAIAAQIELLRTKRELISDSKEAGGEEGGKVVLDTEEAEENVKRLGKVGQDTFEGIADSLADAVAEGKLKFGELAQSIIADLIRIQAKAAILKLFGKIIPGFGSEEPLGTGGASTVEGAQHGGSFIVGGRGGTDANLALLRLTRGERVDVTPAQEVDKKKSGSIFKFEMNANIDARGATPGTEENIRQGLRDFRKEIISEVSERFRTNTL